MGASPSVIAGLLSGTGSVYLINPKGVIISKHGVVDVGGTFAGSTLDVADSQFMAAGSLTFSGPSAAAVVNYGRIGALGGDVALIAATVDNAGSISAANGTAGLAAGYRVVLRDRSLDNGKFAVLLGGSNTSVTNAGVIAAADAELRANGGNIYALAGNTTGIIRATGVKTDQGKVWLVAEGGTLDVAGAISAVGAKGSAGAIETSGHSVGLGTAAIDAHGGTWLIDPYDLTINSTAASTIDKSLAADTSVTLATTATGASGPGVQNSSGNGDIIVDAPISWTTAAALTLSAYRNITIDAPISLAIGTLSLTAGTGNTGPVGPGTGAIAVNAPVTVSEAGVVNLTAAYDTATTSGYSLLELNFAQGSSLNFGSTNNGAVLTINGQAYTLIYSLTSLAALNGGNGYDALATGLTAPTTPYSASLVASFGGVFEGLGNTITGLTINDQAPGVAVEANSVQVGMFGTLNPGSVVRDVGLVGGSVTASGASVDVGDLVGFVSYAGGGATIANVYATGTASSTSTLAPSGGSFSAVGTLAGVAGGLIIDSYGTGAVIGNTGALVGGLVGYLNGGRITNGYATGSVTSLNEGSLAGAGGLVGGLGGAFLTNVYATGLVIAGPGVRVGGIAGLLGNGALSDDYNDSRTTGQGPDQSTSLTTAQLQAGLPSGFSTSVWGQLKGYSFPYLLNFFPAVTSPQVISGYSYAAVGGSALAGATVDVAVNGSTNLGSSTTGADGYYYLLLPQGSVVKGATVTTWLDNATYQAAPVEANGIVEGYSGPSNLTGLNLYGDTLYVMTGAKTLSAMEGGLASGLGAATSAAGSNIIFSDPGGSLVLPTNASLDIRSSVLGFTFNQGLNLGSGDLLLASSSSIGQSAGAITTGEITGGAHGGLNLASTSNTIGTLGPWSDTAGGITLADTEALTVSGLQKTSVDIQLTTSSGNIAIDGTIEAPILTLIAQSGALTESDTSGTIKVGTLNATADTGITLTSPKNAITTIGTNQTVSGPDQINP